MMRSAIQFISSNWPYWNRTEEEDSQEPAQAGDAFHQILNGLARIMPHDRSVYLKSGEKILNWTAGPVGDLKPW
ncbi:hypothetical protein DKX38_023002 [Salix brachista]|uniref:Uncharacterized protein n=1 Tax=Salix brachista TaxID=2182728 RepID=A0A5N5K5M2_9ROSI|nr:hypothetical protein DKX38_023002 [Salix brachista]